MLDIQLLRKDLPAAVAGLKRRGFEFDEAGFRALEDERRKVQLRTEELQAKRNALSKQVGALKSKGEDASAVLKEVGGIGDELKANETALAANQAKLDEFLRRIPNIPRPEVPEGREYKATAADRRAEKRLPTPSQEFNKNFAKARSLVTAARRVTVYLAHRRLVGAGLGEPFHSLGQFDPVLRHRGQHRLHVRPHCELRSLEARRRVLPILLRGGHLRDPIM